MPSPVGHSLIGLGVALGATLPRGPFRGMADFIAQHKLLFLACIVAANMPDIDYVPGVLAGDLNLYHHGFTHTLGWVLSVSLGVWLCWRAAASGIGWKEFALIFAVMSSHLVADFFTDDGRFPYGIMIAWPLSSTYFLSPVPVFWKLMKKDWADVFQFYNVVAVSVEVLWGLTFLAVIFLWKRCMPSAARRDSRPPAGQP